MQKIASVHTSNLQKVKQQYQSFTLSWFGFGDGMGLIGESYNQTTQKKKNNAGTKQKHQNLFLLPREQSDQAKPRQWKRLILLL